MSELVSNEQKVSWLRTKNREGGYCDENPNDSGEQGVCRYSY